MNGGGGTSNILEILLEKHMVQSTLQILSSLCVFPPNLLALTFLYPPERCFVHLFAQLG